jgi:putative flavoprotein involved in K+ transport
MDTTDTQPTTDIDTDIETVVIGAGQAGLATGYHLQRRGIPFVILDAAARVGDNWRRQWDSLRLYSPAHVDGPPGLPFPAPRWTFPGGGPDRSGVLSLSLSPTASSA